MIMLDVIMFINFYLANNCLEISSHYSKSSIMHLNIIQIWTF